MVPPDVRTGSRLSMQFLCQRVSLVGNDLSLGEDFENVDVTEVSELSLLWGIFPHLLLFCFTKVPSSMTG